MPTHDTVRRMTETQYQSAVTEARTLVKRTEADQWRLAQLTWENSAPYGKDGKKNTTAWAADIGVDQTYATRIRQVWEKYAEVIHRPPFSEAYNEFSPHSAYQSPKLTNQTVIQQAAEIQAALRDPQVANRVFADSSSKVEAMKAIHHNDQHLSPLPPAPQPSAPTKLDVLVLLGEAKDTFRRATRVGVTLGLAGDADVLSDLGDALDEGEKFHRYLVGMGLDEAIEKIMEGA